jgi:hypothetical protein
MAKVRAGFNEQTKRWRWVPKVWHLCWDFSPSGSTYYFFRLPEAGEDIWKCLTHSEREALAFADPKVARGAALCASALFSTQVITCQRWNGYPAAANLVE